VQKREVVFTKTLLCAQTRIYFYENAFVCTSGLIVCKRHTPLVLGISNHQLNQLPIINTNHTSLLQSLFKDWLPFTIQLQSFISTLNHIQIIIIFFQKLSDHPTLQTATSFDKPLSVSTSHEKLYPSSLNYTYLVNKYSPTNRHELPDPSSYKTQQEQQTSKVTTSSIVSLIKGLAPDTIDGNGSVPKRRQNKSMSDELEVAVTVELESDEDLIGDASLSTCPKLSMNTGADIGNLGIGN
jgi:hypothetical protein